MLTGRKVLYIWSFRPINIGVRRKRDVGVDFLAKPSRPGRLVAATACQGRHETPGTQLGRPQGPRRAEERPRTMPATARESTGLVAGADEALDAGPLDRPTQALVELDRR